MAGNKNLKPFASADEAREKGRKGGIASAEARRRKKDMRQLLEIVLENPAPEMAKKVLDELGISEAERTAQAAIVAAMMKRAMQGNSRAAEFIRDTVGDKQAERVEVSTPISDKVVEVEKYMDEKK